MSKLDESFQKHLEGIREELNAYIEAHQPITFYKLPAPAPRRAPAEKKKVSVQAECSPALYSGKGNKEWPDPLLGFGNTLWKGMKEMIDEKGLKDSDVYKRANIDRRLFSKIRADEDYVPSRKTAISFCLALQLELEEAKKLLASAGYTLSTSSRFDLIIMYLIENCEYDVLFANIVLDDYGEGTLSR